MFTLSIKLQGLEPAICMEEGSKELSGPSQMGRDFSQGVLLLGNSSKQTWRTKAGRMDLANLCEPVEGMTMYWLLQLGISVRCQVFRLKAEG